MSTPASAFPEVVAFRRALAQAVAGLPRSERDTLLEQIDAHLDESISPASSAAQVHDVIDGLGTPEAIARAAGCPPPAGRRTPYHEILALLMLTLGGVLLPIVGWLIGVILLWTSIRWSRAQKWLGTLVWPGGLGGLLLLGGWAVGSSRSCGANLNGRALSTCSSAGGSASPGEALAILALVAPLAVAVYLAMRIRMVEAADPATGSRAS